MEVAACSFPESKQIEGPRGPSRYAAVAKLVQAPATLRKCATSDSKHVKETHLDQTVLVSARGTNRKPSALWPTGRIVPRHDKKIPQQKAKSAYGPCLLDKHAIPKVAHWARVSQMELSNFTGYLKWLGVEHTSGNPGHFGTETAVMTHPGMTGYLTSPTMQNAAVCFEEGHQNRCCNLRAEGSCFKCAKPMWRSDCWSDPLSNHVPPFARQTFVAKWKWLRAPSQKANRSKALEALAVRGSGQTCQHPLH